MFMFKLTRPCATCPFRKGQGEKYLLGAERIEEIFKATAFQCHKTVDYENFEDNVLRQGNKPEQCAGLMSLLHREGHPNQIMQVGERLGDFNPNKLDHTETYDSIELCLKTHKGD